VLSAVYYLGGDSVATVVLFSLVSVRGCMGVCLSTSDRLRCHHEIFLWERNMVKSWDDFDNGCIPMHCGMTFYLRNLLARYLITLHHVFRCPVHATGTVQ